ncbi:MAG: alpha/beta hydrolase [Actinobacteria bacterium]|nr:alpha/beta hydrolase [Actinomycetota bacterium]
MTEPRSRVVTFDGGLRLHVLEWGSADAPAAVVLHGFTGHAWQAEATAAVLSDRYRVIAVDQRGHGDSDRAAVYGTVPMVADLMGVLDDLGVAQCALVGHSLGGLVGTCAVGLHPERFTHLVLGDIGPEPAPEGVARIRANAAARHVFTSVDDAFAVQAELSPTADPVALRHRVEHNLVPVGDGTLTWKTDPALRDGSAPYDNHAADELWAFLAAIDVPILILRGALSDILSVPIAERMLATNPRASLVTLPGAGHSIATDAPDLVAVEIDRFLSP